MTALGTLTERSVLGTVHDGDLVFSVLGPVAFFVRFNITLRKVIDSGGRSLKGLLEPVVGVRLVVERGHFAVSDRAVQVDRFAQFVFVSSCTLRTPAAHARLFNSASSRRPSPSPRTVRATHIHLM
jgi:hypothetical protein